MITTRNFYKFWTRINKRKNVAKWMQEANLILPVNDQLSFGTGPHLCAGIQLARLEAKIAFEVLLGDLQSIEPAIDRLVYGRNFNMRCLANLPVRLS